MISILSGRKATESLSVQVGPQALLCLMTVMDLRLDIF